MSEVVKQFSFNTDLENWAFNAGGGSGLTFERDANDDSPNDPNAGNGNLETTRSGKLNKDGVPYVEWGDSNLTWEDLGVPQGATVTDVNLDYDWRCSLYTTGANTSSTGPAELRNGAGDTVRGTFSAVETFDATSSWVTKSGTTITGLSDASNTAIRLRIGANPETGNSTSAVVELRQDWIVVTITYSTVTTHYGSATITGQGAADAAGFATAFGAAEIGGIGTASGAGFGTSFGLAEVSGLGGLSGVGFATVFGLVELTGTGGLSATGNIVGGAGFVSPLPVLLGRLGAVSATIHYGVAQITGSGAISGQGFGTAYGQATVVGSGALDAAAWCLKYGVAAITGAGDASAGGWATSFGVVALEGLGELTATGDIVSTTKYGSATITGSGDATGAGWATAFGVSALDGLGTMTPTGVRVVPGMATITGEGLAAAIGQMTAIGTATLTGTGQLVGAGWSTAFAQANLAGTGGLTATAEGAVGWWHRIIEYFHDDAPVIIYPGDEIGG